MKRSLSALFVSILLGTGLVSCGGSGSNITSSGLKFRVFVSNPLNPTFTGASFPVLNIIDATQDVLSLFDVALLGATSNAGMMVESPKRDRTVVFSPTTNTAQNQLAVVENATEKPSGAVTLPGATESMFVTGDSSTLFTAVPTAAVPGQPAGAVLEIDLSTRTITATVPVAGARFVVPSPNGNQILVVSDTANSVSLLTPESIPNGTLPTPISVCLTCLPFDKPVWAVFSLDGSTAYVMNCGRQCGGTTASVAVVDMTQPMPAVTSTVPIPAATYGIIDGGNLYVAGTPLSGGVDCTANLCGVLTIFPGADLTAAPLTLAITDGYHNRMIMAPNNQLFIGSRTCTNVIATSSTPGRGCLSVINTGAGAVYTAAQIGDVTGVQPIDGRTVVYVCENGAIQIYDTAGDLGSNHQLELQTTQITLTGQAVDVKLADFNH